MREFKFRAWDGKKMLRDVTIDGHSHTYAYEGWNAVEMGEHIQGPVMQYIGLKDKNGVECYEDDFIRDCEDDAVYRVVYDLTFGYPAFDVKPFHGSDSNAFSHMICSGEGFEIIGNIYENAELLEAKHD